jgi:hypothetical protein
MAPKLQTVSDFLQGGENFRPIHVHVCSSGTPEEHNWRCNSAYCEGGEQNCIEHGGDRPIAIGREPWRGH